MVEPDELFKSWNTTTTLIQFLPLKNQYLTYLQVCLIGHQWFSIFRCLTKCFVYPSPSHFGEAKKCWHATSLQTHKSSTYSRQLWGGWVCLTLSDISRLEKNNDNCERSLTDLNQSKISIYQLLTSVFDC